MSEFQDSLFTPKLLENHIHNLIQYFYIIGISTEDVFSEKLYSSSNKDQIKPRVISKYPNLDLPYLYLSSDLISSHCFPEGIEIKDFNSLNQKEIKEDNSFIFSLENPNPIMKDEYSRYGKVYFSCILFYEKLSDYFDYYKKKSNDIKLEDKYIANSYVPKIICFCSFVPLYHELGELLKEIRKYVEDPFISSSDGEKKSFFVPICKIIHDVVFNIPCPPKGLIEVNYNFCGKKKFSFYQNIGNAIPNPQINLSLMCNIFTLKEIFEIIKCILLEIPLIFICQDRYILSNLIQGFVSLIYPFEYPYPVLSYMPSNNLCLLNLMKSFIIGISENTDVDTIQVGNKNIVLVRIIEIEERKKASIEHKTPTSPITIIQTNVIDSLNVNSPPKIFEEIKLPSHYTEKTIKKLQDYLSTKKLQDNLDTKSPLSDDYDDEFNKQFRETIYYFFMSFILNYQQFLEKKLTVKNYFNYHQHKIDLNELFRYKDYINSYTEADSNDREFYNLFFSTSVFYKFIGKRSFPKTYQDRIDVIFFDETINNKLNKKFAYQKVDTPFLRDSNAKYKHNEVVIESNLSSFGENEIKYINKINENYDKLIEYFQYVLIAEKNNIQIKYKLFPRLLYDCIFFSALPFYKNPQKNQENDNQTVGATDYYSSYDSVNKQIIFDYRVSYNNYDKLAFPLKTYVELLWVRFIALTFWNSSDREKAYKFSFILNLIQTADFIDNNTMTIIYNNILQYGSFDQISKIFCLLKDKNYIRLVYLKERVSKLLKEEENNNNKLLSNSNISKSSNKKQKVASSNTPQFIQDFKSTIKFDNRVLCPRCKVYIQNFLEQNNYNNKSKFTDTIANCNFCGQLIEPNIKFQIENNKSKSKITKQFKLLSPIIILEDHFNYSNFKITSEYLINEKSDVFWSCIFFFYFCKLDTSFFLPNIDYGLNYDEPFSLSCIKNFFSQKSFYKGNYKKTMTNVIRFPSKFFGQGKISSIKKYNSICQNDTIRNNDTNPFDKADNCLVQKNDDSDDKKQTINKTFNHRASLPLDTVNEIDPDFLNNENELENELDKK